MISFWLPFAMTQLFKGYNAKVATIVWRGWVFLESNRKFNNESSKAIFNAQIF
jgi:hypothetical protein